MVTLKDLEKMMKTPAMKNSLKINARIKRYLKRKFGRRLNSKQYDKVMWMIPDYNPKNEKDAKRIGVRIINKYLITGKLGGNI